MHIITLMGRPNITVEIIPFSAGLHSGIAENFTILEFGNESDSDVVYFESARDSLFIATMPRKQAYIVNCSKVCGRSHLAPQAR